MADPTPLAAAQAVVVVFVRELMDNHFRMPGRLRTDAGALPPPVRLAHSFYLNVLYEDGGHGDCDGELAVFELPEAMGASLVVVGYRTEEFEGTVEVYSPAGEFLAAGVFAAGVVVWVSLGDARRAIGREVSPVALMPRPETLEWFPLGPEACVSAGGRFFITPTDPAAPPPRFQIADAVRHATHEADTFEGARALAAQINAAG